MCGSYEFFKNYKITQNKCIICVQTSVFILFYFFGNWQRWYMQVLHLLHYYYYYLKYMYIQCWFHALKDDSLAKEMNNLFSILGINGIGLVNLPKDNFTKSFD